MCVEAGGAGRGHLDVSLLSRRKTKGGYTERLTAFSFKHLLLKMLHDAEGVGRRRKTAAVQNEETGLEVSSKKLHVSCLPAVFTDVVKSQKEVNPFIAVSSSFLWGLGCAGRSDGPAGVHASVLVLGLLLRRLQDLNGELEGLSQKVEASAPASVRLTYLEGAHEGLVHTHHAAGVVELSAVVGSREQRHQLPLGEELVTVFYHLGAPQTSAFNHSRLHFTTRHQ